ncbi:short-chain dehydrogenase [Candidatus Falkowbacteria bacterium CG10_big_fil_rev_8_21_14_0_10_43_11]|uniref:Short-chain dehydrogenase n=1 Tax=Candidatus Falkowbacteria bacterium CG10_big_fil_rev_8_21_14_0_10_43_11 TaxID=1974568 RepID=A0A2M6WLG1_9BACT|nr:MAG: short-chain dehydrogenase [Candidatus Falkowbacteria bacterium CG10_big_fil_rev_8_21_14_0_10_43_11]
MTLNNKVAIVTGAARGIGRGIADEFIKQGAKVVYSDLAEPENLPAKNAAFIACDVSNAEQANNLIRQTKEKFGGLDILVNNAGIYPFKPFLEMSEAEWDKVLNINLKSVFLCSQAAAKIMPAGGKIVSISSIASFVGFEGLVHYCASKGGINAMIRTMALELAPKKININAVAPGAIDTPGAAADEKTKRQTIAAIPWGRMGLPQDIASAVVFLASDQADYITGQTIIVDGGYTLR